MPDFKKMNENEIRSYIRESESDIEDIEHNYRQENRIRIRAGSRNRERIFPVAELTRFGKF